jgi:alpha-L-rhamnosidase
MIRTNLVEKAEALIPQLNESIARPKGVVDVVKDEQAFQGWKIEQVNTIDDFTTQSYGKNDSVILDFGDHQVGYVTFSVKSTGSPQDAPLRLKLIFGEMPCEIGENFDDYEGWLSRSWLQDEIINMDVLPATIKLPRRYTFRYLKILIIDTSKKYKVAFTDLYCTAVTSAAISRVSKLPDHLPDDILAMDRIAVKTLQNCMQTVFEDGPKRDRRLWIGDLRLQALANYQTFENYALVKRCLYLFAGMTLEGGEVGACIFEKPEPHVDDTLLYDYALFFVATLHDYYEASQDVSLLQELWPVAWQQIVIALERLDDNGIVKDDPIWWCFIDWHPDLNKQAAAHAILIYCLKRGLTIANVLEKSSETHFLAEQIDRLSQTAISRLFDAEKGFFVSGEERQVSWASQVWMVLAGVLNEQKSAALLTQLFIQSPPIEPMTPYMFHHLVEALWIVGDKEKALEQMRSYWGEMVKDGADTFWELYNPKDKKLSPYGSNLINSYCHAWSCTPAYFIRKYLA